MGSMGITTIGEWLTLNQAMPRFLSAQYARQSRIFKTNEWVACMFALNMALCFYVGLFWMCAGFDL